ncbi:MAG: 50S ribosomal protein L1 [Acidimicrobiia bacterium]
MAPHGKKYVDGTRAYDRQALHAPEEAFEILKSLPARNFDETVEVAMRLGIDPRKADQAVRGTVSLPHGTGKSVRVAVFAAGEAAREAESAGAEVVGADDLVGRVEGGFLDFDVAIATPDLMGQVGKLGRVLGPRGLMPNPKSGTVTNEIGKAVSEFRAGKVEYRNDRNGNVHVPIGRTSFEANALVDNYYTLLDELLRARPAATKGKFVKAATASSTMGPGVRIDPAQSRDDRSHAAV